MDFVKEIEETAGKFRRKVMVEILIYEVFY